MTRASMARKRDSLQKLPRISMAAVGHSLSSPTPLPRADPLPQPPPHVPVPQVPNVGLGIIQLKEMALKNPPRALLFDVFGTCVDWRSSVTKALNDEAHRVLNAADHSIATAVRAKATDMTMEDWGSFAQEWRNTYKAFTRQLANDPTKAWKTVDEHHYDSLNDLLHKHGLTSLWNPDEIRQISLIWHALVPWSDTTDGIKALNTATWTVTLTNGNLALIGDLCDFGPMPFTHKFSAEMFGTYKPSPKVYLGAAEKLGIQPQQCAMVAAHLSDLKAAKGCGFSTVYVERPREEDWDAEKVEAARKEGWVDLWVTMDEEGFVTVAEKLGVDVQRVKRRSASAGDAVGNL